ncbi:unnamed protein product [Natator depressus]
MPCLILHLHLILLLSGIVESYSVSQSPPELRNSAGHNATLQCNVCTTDRNPYLFWYPSQPPQHVLAAFRSADETRFAPGKFSAVLYLEDNDYFINKMRLTLEIEEVSLQDSSVNYCVIRPHCGVG